MGIRPLLLLIDVEKTAAAAFDALLGDHGTLLDEILLESVLRIGELLVGSLDGGGAEETYRPERQ